MSIKYLVIDELEQRETKEKHLNETSHERKEGILTNGGEADRE